MNKILIYGFTPINDIITLVGITITPYVYDNPNPHKAAKIICLAAWGLLIIQGLIELTILTLETI